MKKSQPRDWAWHCNELAHSPKHSEAYVAQREQQFALLDNLSAEERVLVHEYGFARAFPVLRQFYGRAAAARDALEAERAALQVTRLKNIKLR